MLLNTTSVTMCHTLYTKVIKVPNLLSRTTRAGLFDLDSSYSLLIMARRRVSTLTGRILTVTGLMGTLQTVLKVGVETTVLIQVDLTALGLAHCFIAGLDLGIYVT